METKVNYAIVGFFVLFFSAAFVGGVIWLASGAQYKKSYDTYVCYMDESVSGLNPNASVRYKGVAVGWVRDISLTPEKEVRLLLEIEKGIAVKEDTLAVLKSFGLTGISTVELSGGSRESPLLKAKPGEPYPVIRSVPSLMARLDTSITATLANLNKTFENMNAAMSDRSREDLAKILSDLSKVSHSLASDSLDKSLGNASKILENGAKASESLPRLMEKIGKSADEIERAAGDAAKTSASARNALEKNMPEIQGLVSDLRELSATLKSVSEEMERNPNSLIFGKKTTPLGPGE